jgi:hypothetical protein
MIGKEGWGVQLQVRISIMRYNRIHGLGKYRDELSGVIEASLLANADDGR